MRRLFDPCCGAGRQGVLAAAAVDMRSDEQDSSYEAWVAYRKAGEKGGNQKKKPGSGSEPARKVKGDGQILNA